MQQNSYKSTPFNLMDYVDSINSYDLIVESEKRKNFIGEKVINCDSPLFVKQYFTYL